jgi:hypothetical protein
MQHSNAECTYMKTVIRDTLGALGYKERRKKFFIRLVNVQG